MTGCGAVVNELLARADEPGSAPGDAVSCFIVPFFLFLFGLCFLILTIYDANIYKV